MRKALFGLLALGIMVCIGIIVFMLYDYLSAEKAWLAWKAERIAKGDYFDWPALVPPDVKDDENFAATPVVAASLRGIKNPDPRLKSLKLGDLIWAKGHWRVGERDNVKIYAQALGVSSLSNVPTAIDDALSEIEKASRKPRSKIPLDLSDIRTANLALGGFKQLSCALRAHTLLSLADNQLEEGFEGILTCLRIAGHLRSEPNISAVIVQSDFITNGIQAIWEGIQDRRFKDDQLLALTAELSGVDLLASTRLAWHGDRHSAVKNVENLPGGDPFQMLYKRWARRNQIETDRYIAECQIDAIDTQNHRMFPERWIWAQDYIVKKLRFRPDLMLAQNGLNDAAALTARSANLQSSIDQALVACALERFRLAKSGYPTSLSELAPAFISRIPNDLVNGQPLKYERVGKSYILYSVGWDLKDDRGAFALNPSNTHNLFEGDWPWIMTAAQPEAGQS